MTTLYRVCERGHYEVLKFLLETCIQLKIDLNIMENKRINYFHWACRNGQAKMADIFIQKSAELKIDLNCKDEDGMTGIL